MKVDVLTVADVQFKWWQWWSDWVDVCVFDWLSDGHVLQMRVSRCNAKQFKCRKFNGLMKVVCPSTSAVGNLAQMKGAE